MGRPRTRPTYLIAFANELGGVGEDRAFDPESDPDKSLLDELQCPVADEVLIALRKAFSLTYPRNPFIDGLKAAIDDIRRIGVEALKPMPEVLADLKLKPIPAISDDPTLQKVYVLKFVFARINDLKMSVKVDGKKKRLLDVLQHQPADAAIRTLREVVAATFDEAHDEDQHSEILRQIRSRIWKVLPEFNVCLHCIEIEPIAQHCE